VFFIGGTSLLGIAAHPSASLTGVWNICGQSLTYLGLAYLAARFRELPWLLRLAGVLGCAVDAIAGILLHYVLESLPIYFAVVKVPDGRLTLVQVGGTDLSQWASINAHHKFEYRATYLGDYLAAFSTLLLVCLVLLYGFVLVRLVLVAFQRPGPQPSWKWWAATGKKTAATTA